MYVTRIDASNLSEEQFRKLLSALEYCSVHDKYGNFSYKVRDRIIKISSPDRSTAFKRGFYLKKKHDVSFLVIKEHG